MRRIVRENIESKIINLLCIPYAGAMHTCYDDLRRQAPEWLNVITVDLVGRESYKEEASELTIEKWAESIYAKYFSIIEAGNYAIFGHSMGATIAYELAYTINSNMSPMPKRIYFSGRTIPSRSIDNGLLLVGSDIEDFKKDVIALGGISDILMKYPGLFNRYISQIRQDTEVLHKYSGEKKETIKCDISVFYGKEDIRFTKKESEYWKREFAGMCNIYEFDGGHFYFRENIRKIYQVFNEELGQ